MRLSLFLLVVCSFLVGVICSNESFMSQSNEEEGPEQMQIEEILPGKKKIFEVLDSARMLPPGPLEGGSERIGDGVYIETSGNETFFYLNLELDPNFESVIKWYQNVENVLPINVLYLIFGNFSIPLFSSLIKFIDIQSETLSKNQSLLFLLLKIFR